jgi:hypothetical protein
VTCLGWLDSEAQFGETAAERHQHKPLETLTLRTEKVTTAACNAGDAEKVIG